MKPLHPTRLFVLATLACVPFFGSIAHAESPADAALRARTKQKVAAMLKGFPPPKRLEFSEAQQKKMMSLWQNNRPTGGPPSEAQRKAMMAKFEAILTPAQRKQMAAQRSQAVKMGTQTVSWLSTELKLTGPQKSKLQALVTEGSQRGMGGRMMGGGGMGRGPGGPGGPGGGMGRGQGGPGGPGGGMGRGRGMGGGRMMGGLGTFFGRRDEVSDILTPAQKSKWEIIKSAAQETMRKQFGNGRGPGGPGGRRGA